MAFTRGNICLAINLITKCHECSSVFNLSHYFYSFFCGDSSATEFGSLFKGAVGALPALTEYCEHLERKRRQGAANCQRWLCA
jgi:hypothetical protein